MEMETISELDVTTSDGRSEFSEYSTISRSLFGMIDVKFRFQQKGEVKSNFTFHKITMHLVTY